MLRYCRVSPVSIFFVTCGLASTRAAQGGRGRRLHRATLLGRELCTYEGTSDFQQRLAAHYREHNERHELPANAAIDPEVRAAYRSKLAREMFSEQHDRPPADDRELSGFLARSSRPQASTVAGYDLTFSPVKNVSALWAIAPREVSELIADTHHDAVADTIRWLEKHAVAAEPKMGQCCSAELALCWFGIHTLTASTRQAVVAMTRTAVLTAPCVSTMRLTQPAAAIKA